jgi:hypothetical protein
MGFEWSDDVFGADVDVVVAEDAEALWGIEGGEDFGAETGGLPGDMLRAGPATDEVSGDQDEVGSESIGLGDHAFEEEGFGVLLEVNVTHLDDAEALECVGEVADGEGAVGDLVLVAGMGSGVGGEADAGCGCCEKAAACEGRWFPMRGGG